MQFPELYQDLQKGRRLNIKMFFVWVSHSIYQGATIMICTTVFWDDSFIQIVSITFSALLFSEMLNILTEVAPFLVFHSLFLDRSPTSALP